MKELKFIHITKCAGTSIENAGKERNILWGQFHTEYSIKRNPERSLQYRSHPLRRLQHKREPRIEASWHLVFPAIDNTIIQLYDWFMVVRNPYDRIVSEYYCKWGGIGKTNIVHTKHEMNNYLIEKIRGRSSTGNHYTEQYKYLHPTVKIHTLKMENLQKEFDDLMTLYNITGVTLRKENTRRVGASFTVADFSKELIELINTVYDKDFELFNYTKITT